MYKHTFAARLIKKENLTVLVTLWKLTDGREKFEIFRYLEEITIRERSTAAATDYAPRKGYK